MSRNSRGRPGTPGLESLRQACCRRDRLRTGSRRVSCGQPLQDSEARRPLLRAARSRGARTRPACPRMHTVIVGLAGRRTEGKDGVCSFESTATASRRTARGGRTWSTRGGCATRLHGTGCGADKRRAARWQSHGRRGSCTPNVRGHGTLLGAGFDPTRKGPPRRNSRPRPRFGLVDLQAAPIARQSGARDDFRGHWREFGVAGSDTRSAGGTRN